MIYIKVSRSATGRAPYAEKRQARGGRAWAAPVLVPGRGGRRCCARGNGARLA